MGMLTSLPRFASRQQPVAAYVRPRPGSVRGMPHERESLDAMAAELPEVAEFMEEFLPAYGRTLDELL